MKLRIIVCVLLCSCLSPINAQTELNEVNIHDSRPRIIQIGERLKNETFYTGIDGRFVLSFADTGYVQARFFGIDGYPHYQKILYSVKGDTIILHNCQKPRISWSVCSLDDCSSQASVAAGKPVIIKFFDSGVIDEKNDNVMRLLYEDVFYVDSLSHLVYIPYGKTYCRFSNVIVIFVNHTYVRLRKDIDTSQIYSYSDKYLKLDLENCFSYLADEALFNEFPIIIRNDSIFPIDNEKNHQCWIDNGFFFPIMTKGQDEPWKSKDIPYWRVGLEGTKFEF